MSVFTFLKSHRKMACLLCNLLFLYPLPLCFKLQNMPSGMPSLRRSCLPAQTIHESSQFIVSSFFVLCYTFCENNSTLQSTAWWVAKDHLIPKTYLCRHSFLAQTIETSSPYTYHLRWQNFWFWDKSFRLDDSQCCCSLFMLSSTCESPANKCQ